MTGAPDWEASSYPSPPPAPEPMRLSAVLDISMRILRRHWAVLLAVAFLFVSAGALLTAAMAQRFNTVADPIFVDETGALDTDILLTDAEFERLAGALAGYFIATIVAGLLASIATLGFSAVVGADFYRREVALGEVLRVSLRRALSALAFIIVTTLIIVGIIIGGAVLIAIALGASGSIAFEQGGPGVFLALIVIVALVVAIAYLTMRWAPALPAMVNEGLGWRDAMRRSWHLSGDNIWRIFVVVLIGALLTALLSAVLSQVLGLLLVDLLAASLGLDPTIAQSVAIALGAILVAPLAPVLTAVLYFDLRVRRDGPASLTGETG